MELISSGTLQKNAATDLVLRDIAKEAFHHVEPTKNWWACSEHESACASSQRCTLGCLCALAIVGDDVDLLACRCLFIDEAEKRNPILVGMPVTALAEDTIHIQRVPAP